MTTRHFGLRIDHPSMSSDTLIASFKVKPNVAQSVGMPRVTPKGARLAGLYRSTYLFFDLGTAASIADGLATALAFAAQHRSVLAQIAATNGTAQVLVHQDFSDANGVCVAPEEISALAELSLGFGFDLLGSTP